MRTHVPNRPEAALTSGKESRVIEDGAVYKTRPAGHGKGVRAGQVATSALPETIHPTDGGCLVGESNFDALSPLAQVLRIKWFQWLVLAANVEGGLAVAPHC